MGKLVWEFWDILGLIFIRHVSNFFCQKIASFKLWKKIICQKHSCLLYMCWKNIPSQTISLLIPRSTKKKKSIWRTIENLKTIYLLKNRNDKLMFHCFTSILWQYEMNITKLWMLSNLEIQTVLCPFWNYDEEGCVSFQTNSCVEEIQSLFFKELKTKVKAK